MNKSSIQIEGDDEILKLTFNENSLVKHRVFDELICFFIKTGCFSKESIEQTDLNKETTELLTILVEEILDFETEWVDK